MNPLNSGRGLQEGEGEGGEMARLYRGGLNTKCGKRALALLNPPSRMNTSSTYANNKYVELDNDEIVKGQFNYLSLFEGLVSSLQHR